MKFVVTTFGFLILILEVHCECLYEFDKNEQECAKALNYTSDKVLKNYNKGYRRKEENHFGLFVECVWHRWKYLDQKGNIRYNTIKNTHNPYFHVTGICDDFPISSSELTEFYREAVEQCEREAQADYRAETARKCIAQHYKRRLPIVEEEKKEGEKKEGEEGEKEEDEEEDEEEEKEEVYKYFSF